MKENTKAQLPPSQGSLMAHTNCYWCGQELKTCNLCNGSGEFKEQKCYRCIGNGRLCPTHVGDFQQTLPLYYPLLFINLKQSV